jgi:hypothetical protein
MINWMVNRLNDPITINHINVLGSIDLIMIDQDNAIRVIKYSIKHLIVSNLINHLILIGSFDQSN